MGREAGDFLQDILECIELIEHYTARGQAAFRRDIKARDAVVLRLARIGEAVKRAEAAGVDLPSAAPAIPWSDIAGMRDLLMHQYWRADEDIVWNTARKDLQPLKEAVRKMLGSHKQRRRPAIPAPAPSKRRR